MAVKSATRWGLLWHSKNRKNGVSECIIYRNCVPALFVTRREARNYAKRRYGYIKTRTDLRGEPWGWRMPRPVRLTVSVEE